MLKAEESSAWSELAKSEQLDLYDHVVLAGAALGAVQSSYPAWGQTFWDHLTIARKLHPDIHTVIILQHENCGAFTHFLNSNDVTVHQRVALTLGQQIQARHDFRDLDVQYWMLKHVATDDRKSEWTGEPLFPEKHPQ